MKKLLLITIVIFIISAYIGACEQTKERNYIERNNNTTSPIVNKDYPEIGVQDNDMPVKEVIESTSFGEILGIINEVEQMLCEGDCSKLPSLTQPQADVIKFRNDIEAVLGSEG